MPIIVTYEQGGNVSYMLTSGKATALYAAAQAFLFVKALMDQRPPAGNDYEGALRAIYNILFQFY